MAERTILTGEARPVPVTLRVVLVEDDDADALLVREILADAGSGITLVRAAALKESALLLGDADCVLLDLGLPDSQGLDGLRWLLGGHPGAAVVVLTGQSDEHLGEAAVRAGAQDYLVKGQVTGPRLDRVVRYAVERTRAQETQRLLHDAQLSAQEKSRLERGLLPVPLLTDPGVAVSTRYRAGGGRMLLGGDFYDLVEARDGWLHAMVGDVCGRGPDEAALGVCLRVAWRTMILAGRPAAEILTTLGTLLEHERHTDKVFATLCALSVAPDRSHGQLYLAGHPPPLLITAGGLTELQAPVRLPLGILPDPDWPVTDVTLSPDWSLLMYTDGLVEGKAGIRDGRLNSEGLVELLMASPDRGASHAGASPEVAEALLDWVIEQVCDRNGGPVDDDLAMLFIRYSPPGETGD